VSEVIPNGVQAKVELSGNLLITEPLSNETDYLHLASCQGTVWAVGNSGG